MTVPCLTNLPHGVTLNYTKLSILPSFPEPNMIHARLFGLFGLILGSASLSICSAQPANPMAIPGPFRGFVVTDERFEKGSTKNRTSMMHDLVTDAGLNPFLIVFTRSIPNSPDAPISKLANRLDKQVIDFRSERFNAFITFLTLSKEYPEDDQRDAKRKEVTDLAAQIKTPNVPLVLAASKSETTETWNLNDNADTTVFLARRMKLLNKWEFSAEKPLDDAAIQQIITTLQTELKMKKSE